jgi:hypothetical protein
LIPSWGDVSPVREPKNPMVSPEGHVLAPDPPVVCDVVVFVLLLHDAPTSATPATNMTKLNLRLRCPTSAPPLVMVSPIPGIPEQA